MTDAELQEAIQVARRRAAQVGPLHSLWDAIADAEALLAGKPTLADWGSEPEARILAVLRGDDHAHE